MPIDMYNPTPVHRELRRRCREFAERELEPRAARHDRAETFDLDAFRKLGDLQLLGLTVPESYGGAGLDATAAVLSYEELSACDPGFALSCLAHSVLFANHLARHGSEAQRRRFLPDACTGRVIGGMAVSSVLTLVVVPVLYVILAGWVDRRKQKKAAKAAGAGKDESPEFAVAKQAG